MSKKGDIGGFLEKEENLSRDARVSGDKIEKENDLINISSNAGSYNITITPNHIRIGCQYHSKVAWFNFSDAEIKKNGRRKSCELVENMEADFADNL